MESAHKAGNGCNAIPQTRSGTGSARRHLLQAGAIAMAGLRPGNARAGSSDQDRMLRPRAGDLLVHAGDGRPCVAIEAAEILSGDAPVIAWAMDPETKLVRDGSRLNQIVLLRLDPATLEPDTRARSAGGLVAYSAICTHAQCTVSGWIQDRQVLHCPCHQSEYDPRNGAGVVAGPAPRPLAALPLKIAGGRPEVAEGFIGKVGMSQQNM